MQAAAQRPSAGESAVLRPSCVIVGGGVIGNAIAAELTTHAVFPDVVMVEAASSVAPAASGNAGGFLARHMCDGEPMETLARLSFDLHERFAAEVGADAIGYRKLPAVSAPVKGQVEGEERADEATAATPDVVRPPFLSDTAVGAVAHVAGAEEAAQVHPRLLTEALHAKARRYEGFSALFNVKVHDVREAPSASGATGAPTWRLTGRRCGDGDGAGDVIIESATVILATGAWANEAAAWFPSRLRIAKTSYVAYSARFPGTFDPKDAAKWGTAVFTAFEGGEHPEIYPRPDGSVYFCGFGRDVPASEVPPLASDVRPDMERVSSLAAFARRAVPAVEAAAADLDARACFLPMPPDERTPMIGRLDRRSVAHGDTRHGVFLAAGHSCWGILNSLGTAVGIRELLTTGCITAFDASRMDPPHPPA